MEDLYEIYTKIEKLPVKTVVKKPYFARNLRGVMHFVHGMCEHKERYYDMMEYFNKEGFICVISDMRGHGENAPYLKDLGYFGDNGDEKLIEDIHAINVFIHNNYPDLPIIMVSHSMGSLITRAYMKKYDKDIDFVFMSGAPSNNIMKYPGIVLAEILALIFSEEDVSRLLDKAFKANLKGYENEEKNAWICSNSAVVKKFNEDELCNFSFTINGYKTLCTLMRRVYSKKNWSVKNPNIPICFIVGSDDKVVGGEKKLKEQVDFLKKIGYKKVKSHVFEGMRHEVFNEIKKEKVWKYMLEKIDRYI